jgi:hypothetical protein
MARVFRSSAVGARMTLAGTQSDPDSTRQPRATRMERLTSKTCTPGSITTSPARSTSSISWPASTASLTKCPSHSARRMCIAARLTGGAVSSSLGVRAHRPRVCPQTLFLIRMPRGRHHGLNVWPFPASALLRTLFGLVRAIDAGFNRLFRPVRSLRRTRPTKRRPAFPPERTGSGTNGRCGAPSDHRLRPGLREEG